MQKLFGSRSQAIQLSSDDEDDFGVGSNGMSSGFGCVSCLPRFTIMGNNGTIRISEEDATLDDYLDPNTATTIEPLLEEYNQQTDNAFNGATLQDSQRFLTRNPFASSTAKSTSTNDLTTQHTTENNDDNVGYQYDSYQEEQHQPHSFGDALPRVDFFLENDENDAEFLSDHRISAVIGDSSKLTNQFELFDTQQDDRSHSSVLENQHGNDGQDDNSMEAAQPFEIQNDWNEALDMDTTVSDTLQEQQRSSNTGNNDQQRPTEMDNAEDTLTDTQPYAKTTTSKPDSTASSPANDNEQTTEHLAEELKSSMGITPEITCASREMDDLTKEMKSMKLSTGNNDDSDMDTRDQTEVPLKDDNTSNSNVGPSSLSTSTLDTTTVHQSHAVSNTQLTDTTQNDNKSIESADQSATTTSISNLEPSILSSPPSPMPIMSTEKLDSTFLSTGLSCALTPAQNVTDLTLLPAAPTTSADDQRLKDNVDDKKPNITSVNLEDTNKDDKPSSGNDSNNTTQLSVGPLAAEPKNGTSTSDGRRRSSVAAVAHSLLGDKLDDITEKLAYIKKNIIMSLDDDDEETDDYYGEDVAKFKQQQQHQQLRRSRSGSMQQEMRRQSFDPSVSRFSGNVQQQQRRQLTRADTADDPRTQHRRSNSLMEGTNSFAKIFQQMGGQHEGDSNNPRHFSPSSFFASLAGPDLPPSSSSSPTIVSPSSGSATATSSPLPKRSSSMSSPALAPPSQQPHQYPAVSRSAIQLHTNQHPPSRPYNHETSSLHSVNEEETIDEEDLFDFSKMIAMGKNVRNISEDLMGNGIRLFNDFSTRMKNANANRLAALEQSSSSTTNQQRQQHKYSRQPQPQQEQDQDQEQQLSSMDQEFLLGDTYI